MKIQPAQMRWLYRTITGKSPLQFRFEFALWTRKMIRVLLREQIAQFKKALSGDSLMLIYQGKQNSR